MERSNPESDGLPERLFERLYVAFPSLRVTEGAGFISVHNAVLMSSSQQPLQVLDLLKLFEAPRRLAEARKLYAPPLLRAAIENGLLVELDQLVRPDSDAIGDSMSFSELVTDNDRSPDYVVFGAPVDVATTDEPGARFGPAEIRKKCSLPHIRLAGAQSFPFHLDLQPGAEKTVLLDIEMRRVYDDALPTVVDVGNVWYMPGESIYTYGERLRRVTRWILQRGGFPILLGGDHSITYFALEAVFEKYPAVGVIHFDAHHDINPTVSPKFRYLNHSRPFLFALESKSLMMLYQLGLRTVEPTYESFINHEQRVSYMSARDLQTASPEQVFKPLARDVPWYLSFDVDCMDPVAAPETGTPVLGGLSYPKALDLIDYAARNLTLIGCDFVEVGRGNGSVNHAAEISAKYISNIILRNAKHRPIESYMRDRMFTIV